MANRIRILGLDAIDLLFRCKVSVLDFTDVIQSGRYRDQVLHTWSFILLKHSSSFSVTQGKEKLTLISNWIQIILVSPMIGRHLCSTLVMNLNT